MPFVVPNPADYAFGGDQWHFCILARIISSSEPNIETSDMYTNVINNNNIALKNISIIDSAPNATAVGEFNNGAVVAVGNPFDDPVTESNDRKDSGDFSGARDS